jgi:subfamily B ATP-binding cassette protein MsbA
MATTTNKNTIISISFAAAVSAVLMRLIQDHIPPSEVTFVTATFIFCILFVVITADPTTFYTILGPWLPFAAWRLHGRKSIQFLQRGEQLVAAAAADVNDASKDSDASPSLISLHLLIDEIRKRIQTRYVIPSIMAGIGVKFIAYQKPKVVGEMFDAVVQPNATMETAFWPFFRSLLLFVIIDFILVSTRDYFKYAAVHRFRACSRTDMLANILDQEQDYLHEERHTIGFAHLMHRETDRMQSIVNESLPRLFFGGVSLLAGIYALMQVDRRLAFYGVVNGPLAGILLKLTRADLVKYGKLYDESMGAANRMATSILSLEVIQCLQAHEAQWKVVEKYRQRHDEFIDYLSATHFRQTLLCLVRYGLNNLEDVLLLGIGLSRVLHGDATIGSYYTFRSHLVLLDQGTMELLGWWNDLMTLRMSSHVYFELMYRESKITSKRESGNNMIVPENCGQSSILMKNVSFAYRLNPTVKVLSGINLHLQPNKILALVGGSGGGKSSITRLLQRFYDPTEGTIELNDININSIDVSWLRSHIRCIDQDQILPPDMTIFENISLGISQTDAERGNEYVRDRVIEAAKLADAHEFIITRCESGYDTPIRQISRLSGGQRQRIAIARALISRAQILICDEITASLDAETEKIVLGTLFKAMKGKTLLVVAHRLSTIRHADEIIFMQDGKIMERGTHDELLLLNGRYCDYLRNDHHDR